MPSSERDPREWPGSDSTESETGGSDPSREAEEHGLDASDAPEPSWRPETPAWDRPVPRSKSTPSGVGGPMDTATPTPTPPTESGSAPAGKGPTGRSLTPGRGPTATTTSTATTSTAKKSTARKSTKRVAMATGSAMISPDRPWATVGDLG